MVMDDRQRKAMFAKMNRGNPRSDVAPTFVVTGERFGKRQDIRTFKDREIAVRFKNLIKVKGKITPAKSAFKRLKIKER